MPNVSLTAPTDYTVQQAAIERQRALAQALQQQAMEPLQTNQMAGGWAIPISPLQGAAKMMQGYASNRAQATADERMRALAEQVRGDTAGTLQRFQAKAAGSPEKWTGEGIDTLHTDATPPDIVGAYGELAGSQNPALQSVGITGAVSHAQQEADAARLRALIQALQGGQGAGQAPAAGGMPGSPQGAPQGVPQAGGSAFPGLSPAVLPLAASGIPGAAGLVGPIQSAYTESNKPVINRGYGVGTMQNGRYVPDVASTQQAADMERAKTGITQQFEPPVTLKTTSGQEIQLSRPEWADYQRTGILPERITGPRPASVPPQDASAYAQVNSASRLGLPATVRGGSLGTVGVSQSQPDQVQQAEQMSSAQSFGRGMGEGGTKIFTDGAASAQALPALKSMEQMGSQFEPGKFAPLKQSLGQWAVGSGLISEQDFNKMFSGNLGAMQSLTSAATRLAAVSLRQSDGNPAVKQLELMLDAMPNKGQTPEGFALTMRFMQAAETMKITKMQEAAAYLREPGHQGDFSGFEDYWSRKLPTLQQQIYGGIQPPVVPQPTPLPAQQGLTPQEQQELNQLRQRFGRGRR